MKEGTNRTSQPIFSSGDEKLLSESNKLHFTEREIEKKIVIEAYNSANSAGKVWPWMVILVVGLTFFLLETYMNINIDGFQFQFWL